MCFSILGSRSFASVFAAGHGRLMGRQILPILLLLSLPDFRIWMIIALSHISVNYSVEIDRLKMLVR